MKNKIYINLLIRKKINYLKDPEASIYEQYNAATLHKFMSVFSLKKNFYITHNIKFLITAKCKSNYC